MQVASRWSFTLQRVCLRHLVPSSERAFRIIPDPKRPGTSDHGSSDEKGAAEDTMRRETEALGQTGQKEKGGDQSFGLTDDDQKAATDRGYDKPQMSRGQSESGGRTGDVRDSMKSGVEESDQQKGKEQVMRELGPDGPGEKPEHAER